MIMTSAGARALHPFFDPEQRKKNKETAAPTAPVETPQGDPPFEQDKIAPPSVVKDSLDGAADVTRNDETNVQQRERGTIVQEQAESIETDPNLDRRKRRKITPPIESSQFSIATTSEPIDNAPLAQTAAEESASKEPPTADIVALPQACQDTPVKTLKLNGRGGFGSPIKDNPKAQPKNRRKKDGKQKHLIAILSYTNDDLAKQKAVGDKIDQILAGNVQHLQHVSAELPFAKPAPTQVSKSTHPFFLAKVAPKSLTETVEPVEKSAQTPERKQVRSFTTPGKLRAAMRHTGQPGPLFAPSASTSVSRSTSGPDAPWTFLEVVKAEKADSTADAGQLPRKQMIKKQRRLKEAVTDIGDAESILELLCALCRDMRESLKIDNTFKRDLHLPTRMNINGHALRVHIQQQLSSTATQQPALNRILTQLPERVSAFDDAWYEQSLWTQKYAPADVESVLQPTSETSVLRAWLESLTISAVQTRLDQIEAQQRSKDRTKLGKRKKHKRHSDLDDFIVSSDEDEGELHNLSENDSANTTPGSSQGLRSLVRQLGAGTARSKANIVLLSGPSGCGKTAAAYAVAKQLNFEVFELHPGTRRSGKDILDRVGDMVQNHQVRKAEFGNAIESAIPSDDTLPETPAQDQKTLSNFFAAKSIISNPTKAKPAARKPQPITSAVKSRPSQQQKQSLILFEEADVLFADDKQFWDTVLDLAHTSKRPIIMTCTDESRIPVDSLRLQAILRLKQPSLDMACDYMLLVAAAEGHLLQRQDVEQLYRSCGHDFRAALTELNFWCQMAVGDDKGGLEWFPRRWPPGSDYDAEGQRVRTISDKTYFGTLGWTAPSSKRSTIAGDARYIMAHQGLWERDVHPGCFANDLIHGHLLRMENDKPLSADPLMMYGRGLDALSDLDIFSGGPLPGSSISNDFIDTSAPPLSAQEAFSYSSAYPLLEADLSLEYSQLSSLIATATALMTIEGTYGVQFNDIFQKFSNERPRQVPSLKQPDLLSPFAPLSISSEYGPSSFEILPKSDLVTTVGPYARAIAAFDLSLEKHRSAMMGGDGHAVKKSRTTRAARSALEGSARNVTRRERWFDKTMDLEKVMSTAGKGWTQAATDLQDHTRREIERLCLDSSPEMEVDQANSPSSANLTGQCT